MYFWTISDVPLCVVGVGITPIHVWGSLVADLWNVPLTETFLMFLSFLQLHLLRISITQKSIVKNKEGMEAKSLTAGSHVSWAAFFVFQLRIPFCLSSGFPLPRTFGNYILDTLLRETSAILFALFVAVVLFIYSTLFICLLYKRNAGVTVTWAGVKWGNIEHSDKMLWSTLGNKVYNTLLPQNWCGNWECCALRVSLVPGCPRCGAGCVLPPWGAPAHVMSCLGVAAAQAWGAWRRVEPLGASRVGDWVPCGPSFPWSILHVLPLVYWKSHQSVVVFAFSCATYVEGLRKTRLLYLPRYLLFLLLIFDYWDLKFLFGNISLLLE